ncbi:hypothetical protein AK812_SmicGene32312 [Symbiodinium microadriaticum]|uniref:Uncharacterized protein n=1 Tax=Symbiodinium microadriaticum TaxID=2951 RepID=A0A1Q9CUF7_SYMMI|nr:hypothetical protein AK812_SmicGene32312 [Symbiodinium microadriaticum]
MEAGLVQLASDYQELLEQLDQLILLPLAVLEKLQGVVEKDLVGEKVPEGHVEKVLISHVISEWISMEIAVDDDIVDGVAPLSLSGGEVDTVIAKGENRLKACWELK